MNAISPAPLTEAELRLVNPRIRLSPREQLALRKVFASCLPAYAAVYIYGSRTDRNARGGDIDLLVHTPGLEPEAELALRTQLLAALERALGERKIDLLFTPVLGEQARSFVQLVMHRAVRLYP
jgi:predicted nucleotidyltransferase